MWESHSYGSERDGAATANPGAPRLLDPALEIIRPLDHVYRAERGQAGDLEMVQAQGGAKPLGKGLVNHPVSSSKWVMRAME